MTNKKDVYSEEFQAEFYALLSQFVEEYDDMANMEVIQKAQALKDSIDNL